MVRVRFPPLFDALLLGSVMSRRIGTGHAFAVTEFDVELLLDSRRVMHDRWGLADVTDYLDTCHVGYFYACGLRLGFKTKSIR